MKRILFLIILCCSSAKFTLGVNDIGSYISYTYVSANSYKVQLHLYRDCRSVGLADSIDMTIEADNNCFNNINFKVSRDTILNQTIECSSGNSCNIINGMGNAGLEEHIYSKIIDFGSAPYKTIQDSSCCDVYFTYNSCCRPGAITTGISGSSTNYAYLNICKGKQNNSVKYENPMVQIAYCNNTFEYNPFAIDSDGDSLVFSLDTPLGANRTSPLSYNTPLSAAIPITPICTNLSVTCPPAFLSNFYIGFDFDSITNNIRLTPKNCSEVSTFVNRTDEYRKDTSGNWTLIGSTRRDQLLFVQSPANNQIPYLETEEINYLCVGDTFRMAVNSKDDAPSGGLSDSTYLIWDHSITDLEIGLDNPIAKNQTATVSWAPTSADISNNAYLINFKITESNCMNAAQTSKAIQLFVVDTLSSNYTLTDRNNGTLVLNSNISGGSTLLPNQITWLIDSTPSFQNPLELNNATDSIKRMEPGKYYIRLLVSNSSNCPIEVLDSITISPYFRFNFAGVNTQICKNNETIFEPNVIDAQYPVSYQWYVNGSPIVLSTDSFLRRTISGTETFLLNANDNNGKNYFETITFDTLSLPDLSTVKSPMPRCFDEGKFDLYANFPTGVNISQATKDSSVIWFKMNDSRRDTMISKSNNAPYWYYTDRFFDNSLNQNFIPNPNVDTLKLFAQNTHTQCIDSLKVTVNINPNPEVLLKNTNICQGVGSFRLNPELIISPSNPDAGIYTWEIDSAPSGITTFDLSQILENRSTKPTSKYYWFNATIPGSKLGNPGNVKRKGTYKLKFCFESGSSNCGTCQFVYLTIDSTAPVTFKPFDLLCYSDNDVQLDSFVNLKNGIWQLKEFNGLSSGAEYDDANARLINANQIKINQGSEMGGEYYLKYRNSPLGCVTSDSVLMSVAPKPLHSINIDSQYLFLGETVLLEVTADSGLSTTWENGNINKTRLIREFATPAGTQLFINTAVNLTTSCSAKDTAVIIVVKSERPVSVSNLLAEGTQLFPNPIQNKLTIKSKISLTEVKIFDSNGKTIFFRSKIDSTLLSLDLSKFANGNYFIQIKSAEEEFLSKIQKIK